MSPDRIDRSRMRWVAAGLALGGLVATAAGVAATETTALDAALGPVLLSIGAVGIAGGLLTWGLVPRAVVPSATARRVHRAMADNRDALLSVFDLSEDLVYVPTGRDPSETPEEAVRLLALSESAAPPATVDPDQTVLGSGPSNRGVSLRPSGAGFLTRFYRDLAEDPGEEPELLSEQLADAAVESFDLARRVQVAAETEGETVVFRVRGDAFGTVERDTPVGSFLASGLAVGLERPVSMRVETEEQATVVTCRLLTTETAAVRETPATE